MLRATRARPYVQGVGRRSRPADRAEPAYVAAMLEPFGEGVVFDHAAHAAPRVRDLLVLYRDQLGGRFLYGGPNERVGYRALNLGFSGGGKIELMEPLPGSSFFNTFFARNPRGGLHHLTFLVPDVEESIARARGAGFDIVGIFLERPEWREAFVHPRSGSGALVQFVQAAPGYPPHGLGESVDAILGDS
jgi:methylmalonyl-CoA/ethylmalonyl-CoA epimerase